MVDFKKDTWIYVLIAAILALICLFVPIASDSFMGMDYSIWWSGAIQYSADADPEWFGSGAATIWTLGFTCMSIATLLIFGILSMKGTEFKWDWLIYVLIGIGLIIFPILQMVYDLEDATIGFAPIGILISGILCVAAFAIDKFVKE